jgi:hypothetical protein
MSPEGVAPDGRLPRSLSDMTQIPRAGVPGQRTVRRRDLRQLRTPAALAPTSVWWRRPPRGGRRGLAPVTAVGLESINVTPIVARRDRTVSRHPADDRGGDYLSRGLPA